MRTVAVAGGGLAGLAAAASLAEAGFAVDLFESRAFPGGRATSYPIATDGGGSETIDNCQHVLLRCCTSLIGFYERLGCLDRIRFHREFYFLEPGGRTSVLKAGLLPAPLHFTGSFLGLRFLAASDKIAIGRAMLAMRREAERRDDLDRITFLDWLGEKRQSRTAIERFWRPVLVSAINEDLDRMAARHAFQVFRTGFLVSRDGYEMGVPSVALGELYGTSAWTRWPNVRFHFRSAVRNVSRGDGGITVTLDDGARFAADGAIVAVPFERAAAVAPDLGLSFEGWEHSPITGVHLWFDRSVTGLPHATLLDRTIQWFFNKGGGRYIQLVISASRGVVAMGRQEIVELCMRELAEFLPRVRDARVERAHVVKEVRATFSARPGLEALRPGAVTAVPGIFLAGDWTNTGWPATMEGAVRSGNEAARAAVDYLGGAG